jgi:hypothetical protein
MYLERLSRHVRRPDGRDSARYGTLGAIEQDVGYLENQPDQPTSARTVRRALALPRSQVRVALGFLVARSLLARHGRRLSLRSRCLQQWPREQFCLLALAGR